MVREDLFAVMTVKRINKTVNHLGWSYRIYDNSGNVQNNSDKVGAEVAPVSGSLRVVWAYGPWNVLN